MKEEMEDGSFSLAAQEVERSGQKLLAMASWASDGTNGARMVAESNVESLS